MKEIVRKLVEAEREMAGEKGRFLIFALFLREDAPDRWDVVVAAPWVAQDKAGALQYIAAKLGAHMEPAELIKLSRIVLIEPDNPGLSALQHAVNLEHGIAEIKDSNFFGLQIKHAFIITSRQSEEQSQVQPLHTR